VSSLDVTCTVRFSRRCYVTDRLTGAVVCFKKCCVQERQRFIVVSENYRIYC